MREFLKQYSAAIAIAAIGYGFIIGLNIYSPATPDAPRYEWQAIDQAGNLFIAGSGDDCNAAYQGAVFPANWREVICVQVR